jgi:dolichyl-diphosphooligosaccharide--protein glycosyltransferase
MINMSRKELVISFCLILIIFLVGFFLRAEAADLSGIPADERANFQDQNGLPYMYDMDSYYHYRLTSNFINHGYLGDTIINGTEYDLHSYFPPGKATNYPPMLIYLTATIFYLVNFFTEIPLIYICYWLIAFIAPLSGVIAYLFTNRITNKYGAFIAGILTVVAPFYFFRTIPSWFDTDVFILLFPLLISWIIFEATNTDKNNKLVLYSILAGIITVLFALSWDGWAYIFFIIILAFLVYFISSIFLKFKITNSLKVFAVFISVVLFLVLVLGFSNLDSILFPLNFVELSSNSNWPNIYLSVAELRIPSLMNIIIGTGPFLLGLGILGLICIPIYLKKKETYNFLNQFNWFFYIFLLIWVLIGVFSLIKGVRFILLLIPPLIIASGIMTGLFLDFLSNSKLKDKKLFISLFFMILILIPSVMMVYDFDSKSKLMDDEMYDAGIWINENTSNNTIIVSDWVYGHFFTAVSNRPVLIDGSTQNSPRTYLIYKAFVTDNETLSVGIFRMLTNSGDMGYLTLNEYTGNTTETVEILNDILGVDNNTAKEILIKNYEFTDEMADNILEYTHPAVENSYVLVTNDNMLKTGSWVFDFGEWDFVNNANKNFVYSYGNLTINQHNITSDDGLFMDLETQNILWNNTTPYNLIIIENGSVEKRNINNESNLSVILNIDEKIFVVIDKQFEDSLFTKLVIEKVDSKFFKKIYKNQDVMVWRLEVNE